MSNINPFKYQWYMKNQVICSHYMGFRLWRLRIQVNVLFNTCTTSVSMYTYAELVMFLTFLYYLVGTIQVLSKYWWNNNKRI